MRKKVSKTVGISSKTAFLKKHANVAAAVAAVTVWLTSWVVTVQANPLRTDVPEVNYDGIEQVITFENTDGTDLFLGFKDLMPGDEREQEIVLNAKKITRETSFYLRAECDAKTEEILKDVEIDLYADGKLILEDGVIFEDLKLGTISDKRSLDLKAVLTVPETLGNEVAGKDFDVKWYFTAQEDGKEIAGGSPSDHDDAVQTGDDTTGISSFLLLAAGSSVLAVAASYRKKLSKSDQ